MPAPLVVSTAPRPETWPGRKTGTFRFAPARAPRPALSIARRPPAVAMTLPVAVAVRLLLSVKLTPGVMAVIVVPTGIPTPATDWPTTRPVVLAVVTIA